MKINFAFCFNLAPSVPPTSITATNINATTVSFSWQTLKRNDTNGDLVAFAVKLVRLDTSVEIQRNISSSLQSFIASGLKPYANYSITIAAVNRAGVGPYSTSVIIETLQSGKFPFLLLCGIFVSESSFCASNIQETSSRNFCVVSK